MQHFGPQLFRLKIKKCVRVREEKCSSRRAHWCHALTCPGSELFEPGQVLFENFSMEEIKVKFDISSGYRSRQKGHLYILSNIKIKT